MVNSVKHSLEYVGQITEKVKVFLMMRYLLKMMKHWRY